MKHPKLEINSGRTDLARFPGRAIVIGMLIAAPWMLGSVGGWSQALLCFCGLIALAFWWLEIAVLRPKQIIMPLSVLPILLGVGLGVVHFMPLPSNVATTLGASQAYQQWDSLTSATGMDREMVNLLEWTGTGTSRELLEPATKSISIDPNATRIMTAQLVLAAICYLLGAHFFHDRKSLVWLCIFLTVNGVAISLFGIVQKIAGEQGLIFGVIPVTGGLFGPYVNRNNAAGLLVMCLAGAVMLTITAFQDEPGTQTRYKRDLWFSLLELVHGLNAGKLACVFSVMFIVAGVVVSLSRGGTLAVLAGAIVTFLVLGINNRDSRQGSLVYLLVAVVLGASLVAWLGFGEKLLERFDDADKTEIMQDARVENWTDTAQLIPKQWLLGSGLSTYQHVHRPYRSTAEDALYYFAENQYFQSIVDGGVVGLALLVGMIAWSIYFVKFLIASDGSGKMLPVALFGSFAIASQMVSGFFDFGLYMPANMITFAIIMGSLGGVAQSRALQLNRGNAGWGLGRVGVALLLVLFSGGILSLFQFYRLYRIQDECLQARQLLDQEYLADPSAVNSSIQRLSEIAAVRPDVDVQKILAELKIDVFRLSQHSQIMGQQKSASEAALKDFWARTKPSASALFLKQQKEVSPERATGAEQSFRSNRDLRTAVLGAYEALLRGRRVSPFSAEVHLRLAELGTVLTDESPKDHMERVLKISPKNPGYQMLAGVFLLRHSNFATENSADFEPAIEHLRTAIELDPRVADLMQPLVVQQNVMGIWVYGLKPEVFARQILINSPPRLARLLGSEYFAEKQELKHEIMGEAIANVEADAQIRYRGYNDLLALARMAVESQNWTRAVEFADLAKDKMPAPNEATYVYVDALIGIGDLIQAKQLLLGLPRNRAKKYEETISKKELQNDSQTQQ